MSNSNDRYELTGEQLDQKFSELEARIDTLEESGVGAGGGDVGGGDADGILQLNLENLAAALEPYLDLESGGEVEIPADVEDRLNRLDSTLADVQASVDALSRELEAKTGRSDEEIRQLIREYVDEHGSGGSGDGLTRAEVERIVTASLDDLDITGFDEEVIERVRHHAEALDFPARKVGPSEPTGDYHSVGMWGIKFATGRGCYIREATVDAATGGSFTAVLGETDGIDQFDQVDSTTISVDEGVQRVTLDLEVPSEGYWLLAREGGPPLRRGQWNGWDDHMVDNLRLRAGDKPGFEENSNWYYFFDMEMTANERHEFPD